MTEAPLPDGAEWTEHGWRLDRAGRIDPRPSVHWSTGVVLVAALLVGLISSWWLMLVFLPAVLVTLDPTGGTPIYGVELRRASLEILGLTPYPLQQVAAPRARDDQLVLTLNGVERTLVFDQADPQLYTRLAERIERDLAAHGSTEDVPAKMHALREAET